MGLLQRNNIIVFLWLNQLSWGFGFLVDNNNDDILTFAKNHINMENLNTVEQLRLK